MKKSWLDNLNIPRALADHTFGEQHSEYHRLAFGGVIMLIGVTVAKGSASIHIEAFHYIGDLLGYLIHGIGAVPFVDKIIKK